MICAKALAAIDREIEECEREEPAFDPIPAPPKEASDGE